jgi:hypothetical protein
MAHKAQAVRQLRQLCQLPKMAHKAQAVRQLRQLHRGVWGEERAHICAGFGVAKVEDFDGEIVEPGLIDAARTQDHGDSAPCQRDHATGGALQF